MGLGLRMNKCELMWTKQGAEKRPLTIGLRLYMGEHNDNRET